MSPLVTMPVPPASSQADYAYYQAFVRVLNAGGVAPGTSLVTKLRRAIEATADTMGTSPAHIARLLVEYGFRAPREAFPPSFVDFVDSRVVGFDAVSRAAAPADVLALQDFWHDLPVARQQVAERLLETA